MMRVLLLGAALLAVAAGQPPDQVQDLGASTAGEPYVTYRVTIGTTVASQSTVSINLLGEGGKATGFVQLRYYRHGLSYKDAGAQAAALHPGVSPSNCDEATACKPRGGAAVAYGTDVVSTHRAQIYAADVGSIQEIQVQLDGDGDAWKPSFLKVNANNPDTGIGNGVYYVAPKGEEVQPGKTFKTGVNGVKLSRCQAQVCERRMDAEYLKLPHGKLPWGYHRHHQQQEQKKEYHRYL